jgi:hypothetical protein
MELQKMVRSAGVSPAGSQPAASQNDWLTPPPLSELGKYRTGGGLAASGKALKNSALQPKREE